LKISVVFAPIESITVMVSVTLVVALVVPLMVMAPVFGDGGLMIRPLGTGPESV
jgi:hypothetical protein